MWSWNLTDDLEKPIGHLCCCSKLCAAFHTYRWIQTWVIVRKRTICVKFGDILSHVTLKFDGWPWKKIGHLSYATTNFYATSHSHRWIQTGVTVQKRPIWVKISDFVSCDIEIWSMTLTNNRASLLCYFKLCATFHSHRWILTWVTVRKRPIWVKIGYFLSCVTLKFDGWPWIAIGHLSYALWNI